MSQLATLFQLLMDPASVLPVSSLSPWEQWREGAGDKVGEVQDMDVKVSSATPTRVDEGLRLDAAKRAMAAGGGVALGGQMGQEGHNQNYCLCGSQRYVDGGSA